MTVYLGPNASDPEMHPLWLQALERIQALEEQVAELQDILLRRERLNPRAPRPLPRHP